MVLTKCQAVTTSMQIRVSTAWFPCVALVVLTKFAKVVFQSGIVLLRILDPGSINRNRFDVLLGHCLAALREDRLVGRIFAFVAGHTPCKFTAELVTELQNGKVVGAAPSLSIGYSDVQKGEFIAPFAVSRIDIQRCTHVVSRKDMNVAHGRWIACPATHAKVLPGWDRGGIANKPLDTIST